MKPTLTRRRFLSISAAAGVCITGPAVAAPVARWTGTALGAHTSMQLSGLSEADARPVFRAVERELTRLERIFSLYITESQLVQLNATGMLRAPAPEMLEVLSLCDRLHQATDSVFDPTLQPLWMLYAQCAAQNRTMSGQEFAAARALIGWQYLRFDSSEIRLDRPGMALTLNGVAQGYITDQVGVLLKQRGLRDVLIDMGEIAGLGRGPDGAPWAAGVAMPDGQLVGRVRLTNRALATSAPAGTILDSRSGLGHIFDPRGVRATPLNRLVAVSAPQAAVADGLSTAGCLLSSVELAQAIGSFRNTKLETLI